MGPMQVKTVEEIKALRVQIDAAIQVARTRGQADAADTLDHDLYYTAEGQAIIKLIEAKMWCGKMLEALGTPFPAELADKAPVNGQGMQNGTDVQMGVK